VKIDAGWAAVILTGLAMGAAGAKWVWPFLRKIAEFLEDWRGEDPRAGYPGRPGIPERMRNLESEFVPNHGGSAKDAWNRIEHALLVHIQDPAAHHSPAAHPAPAEPTPSMTPTQPSGVSPETARPSVPFPG
jgi:hypothetical protein